MNIINKHIRNNKKIIAVLLKIKDPEHTGLKHNPKITLQDDRDIIGYCSASVLGSSVGQSGFWLVWSRP